jgi:putative restriction endonuclease
MQKVFVTSLRPTPLDTLMFPTPETKYGSLWSHDELVLALYLYCQIPFAQTKAANPKVQELARILGRTPSSVARKLGNFGAFDPLLAQRGIVGLAHFSKADQEVWQEFFHRWEALVEESERLFTERNAPDLFDPEPEPLLLPALTFPTGPTVQSRLVLTRVCQSFFRRAVLASYGQRCCLCALDLPSLLVASHIKPWALCEESRADPENGLCLCALHDKAFDRGLISVTENYQILIAPIVKKSKAPFTEVALTAFESGPIHLPTRFAPKSTYLQWHRENVFQV